jgi:hypothetical protein
VRYRRAYRDNRPIITVAVNPIVLIDRASDGDDERRGLSGVHLSNLGTSPTSVLMQKMVRFDHR